MSRLVHSASYQDKKAKGRLAAIQLFTGAPQQLKINFSMTTLPFLNRFQCSIYQNDGLSMTQRAVHKATCDKSIQLFTGVSRRLKTDFRRQLSQVVKAVSGRHRTHLFIIVSAQAHHLWHGVWMLRLIPSLYCYWSHWWSQSQAWKWGGLLQEGHPA
jgi:hypothetical protein